MSNRSNHPSQHSFAQIPKAEIQRSTFDRSHTVKTTFNSGWLVPIFVDEALPGDTFSMKTQIFCRIATLLNPIMDNVYLDTFFFAVPNRLLWDNWEKFNGAQDNPGDSTEFLIPQIVNTGMWTLQDLPDYLGIPTGRSDITFSALFTRAYNLIWNEWFRDENLQNSVVVDTDDGPDDPADYTNVLSRGKRHDYFTSCLPWPSKGDPVELSFGGTAPVTIAAGDIVYDGTAIKLFDSGGDDFIRESSGFLIPTGGTGMTGASNAGFSNSGLEATGTADLSAATGQTINNIREAFQIQRLYERDARGGTRLIEIIKAHFGVTSPDARHQRPEFLGGGTTPVVLTPLASTMQNANRDLGDLGAYGIASGSTAGFTKSFTEHCIIIGLVASRADLNYQEGMNRMFSRSTRWDFYWPALSHLGEQEVLNKEIYAVGSLVAGQDDLVFGYQERFAEYRYKPSMITATMRSGAAGTLDVWHLAQDFASLPVLDATFITENPPMDRVIAVTGNDQFLFDGFFQLKCARPMPTYSVPGMVDHF